MTIARARVPMRLLASACLVGCASMPIASENVPAAGTAAPGASPTGGAAPIGQDALLVPTGFGSLRQDDIAIRLALPGGLQVRAAPLDESFIRLLSPDSYRAMRELLASRETDLERLRQRTRLPSYSLWVVNFFAQEQGETRFSPLEVVIRNAGRDFRPLDAFPLTPGFGEYRLRQRETQSAVLAFDGLLDANQPLSMIVETVESSGWQVVLQRVERERALVRSRANAAARRDTTSR